jgi:NAD(P)-dependent dehydrogenase (short-subunit alcohol dehydrogenase family)
MSDRVAFITGVTGQDGGYLAELLLGKGYVVHGVKRRSSSFDTERVDHLYRDLHEGNVRFFLHYGDMTDATSPIRIVQDVRAESPTYGRWHGEELSTGNRLMLYVPKGVDLGFQALMDDTKMDYEITPAYVPNAARGTRFDDPTLAVDWPVADAVVSPRDRELPFLGVLVC